MPLFLVLLTSHALLAGASSAGGRVWVSEKALDYTSTTVMPQLIAKLQKFHIPDIKGEKDSFDYSFTNFALHSVAAKPVLTFVAGQGVPELYNVAVRLYCNVSLLVMPFTPL